MNDNEQNTNNPINPPKIKFLDNIKYKLGYYQGKSKVVTTVVAVALMAGVSIYVSYASLTKKNVSPDTNNQVGASSNSCLLNLTLKAPATSSPTPSGSPTSSVCSISYDSYEQTVCWQDKRTFAQTVTVNSLPTGGEPYYLVTTWAVVSPNAQPYQYSNYTEVKAGQTVTIYPEWPGLSSYNPLPSNIEIHVGAAIYDKNKNLVTPGCTAGKDIYWTPYVDCSKTQP